MAKVNDDAAEFALMPEDRLRRCTPCRFSHRHHIDLLHRSGSYADDIACKQYVDAVPAVVEMSWV
jgi:hypothetical protein